MPRRGRKRGREQAVKEKKRKALSRSQEAASAIKARMSADRKRRATARDQEGTPEQRARRSADRRRKVAQRDQEDTPEARARLSADRRRKVAQRDQEDTPEARARLSADRRRKVAQRDQEDTPEARARLSADRRRKVAQRDQEDTPEARARLSADRRRKVAQRDQEDTPEARARLSADRRRKVAQKDQEDTPEARARLSADRRRKVAQRDQEDTPEARARLSADRRRKVAQRDQEDTPEARARLSADRRRKVAQRDQEDTPQRQSRIRKVGARRQIRLSSESVVQRNIRNRRQSSNRSSSRHSSSGMPASPMSTTPTPSNADNVRNLFGEAAKVFCDTMSGIKYDEPCIVCNESFPGMTVNTRKECLRCARDKKPIKKFSGLNKMDPMHVPEELKGLSNVEELLIAQAVTIMSIYRLPHGQLGYRGNIINIPQDVFGFLTKLPRNIKNLEVLVIRKEGQNSTHRDFRVRRQKVMDALTWLKNNNPWYHDIEIDENSINGLPDDGYIGGDAFEVIEEECPPNDPVVRSDESEEGDVGDVAEDEVTFFPVQVNARKESDEISAKVGRMADEPAPPISWPNQDGTRPFDEFNTVGYVVRAFPTLFPYGEADLRTPREVDPTPLEYFRHLMKYKDARFARHPRFRYFALNSILRWQAMKVASYYAKQNVGEEQWTMEDLVALSKKDKQEMAKKIVRFGYNLPGTKAYWLARRSELIAMIDQIGTLPTVFFTFSSADLHWPELHSLLPDYTSKTVAVNENPYICAWFFQRKFDELMATVFLEMGLEDFWGRYEHQHRGSIHTHGVAWLANAPDVLTLSGDVTEDEKNAVIAYFDNLCTTWNPACDENGNLNTYRVNPHPCTVPLYDVNNKDKDYMDLIMICERHTQCKEGYCRKRKNKDGVLECRFGFPKDLCENSSINVLSTEDGKKIEFVSKRNDYRINPHNRQLLQIFRANCDFQPVVDRGRLINYVSKYVTKTEPRSKGLDAVMDSALRNLNPAEPFKRLAQRLLIKAVGDRDYSAQETMVILNDLKLTVCSRTFVHLHLSGNRRLQVSDDEQSVSVSNLVDHYLTRPRELEPLSLLLFTKKHYKVGKAYKNRAKDAIVVVHPRLFCDPNSELYEDYCRNFLMVNKPFREFDKLKVGYANYSEAYDAFRLNNQDFGGIDIGQDVANEDAQPQDPTSDGQETETVAGVAHTVDEWMFLCQRNVEFQPPDFNSDTVDWQKSYRENSEGYSSANEFYEQRLSNAEDVGNSRFNVSVENLIGLQKNVSDYVLDHSKSQDEALRMMILGTAGTGKSYLIHCIKDALASNCVVLAPTGVAAHNIGGATLHSCFSLPVQQQFVDLTGERLLELQEKLADVHYIIIDEVSMVGADMLGKIDCRLRQAFPDKSDQVFGGCSMLLFGDFGQLPPVMDKALYVSHFNTAMQRKGASAFATFTKAAVLQRVVRQQNDNRFKDALTEQRDAVLTDANYRLFSTRFKGHARNEKDFDGATHLYSRVDDVARHNFDELMNIKTPIAKIDAEHNCNTAKRADSDDAGGLCSSVWLAVGAKIMLTANLWVEAGLCNGSMGEVVEIVYANGAPPALPLFVLCKFQSYTGPAFLGHSHHFPIFPIERNFTLSGTPCSRRNVPLTLAWAITVHKCQGLTLDKTVVDIGNKEFSIGIAFVALSRVRKLEDMLLIPFPKERLTSFAKSANLAERMKLDLKLQKLSDSLFGTATNEGLDLITISQPDPVNVSEPFQFSPLTENDKAELAGNFGIARTTRSRAVHPPTINSTTSSAPTMVQSIAGDGNCFFRSISYAIFGDESKHSGIRQLLNLYIQSDQNRDFFNNRTNGEIFDPDIGVDKEWAKDNHIQAAACMLKRSISVYGRVGPYRRWMTFHPIDPVSEVTSPTATAIYLNNANDNHYEVVLNVRFSHLYQIVLCGIYLGINFILCLLGLHILRQSQEEYEKIKNDKAAENVELEKAMKASLTEKQRLEEERQKEQSLLDKALQFPKSVTKPQKKQVQTPVPETGTASQSEARKNKKVELERSYSQEKKVNAADAASNRPATRQNKTKSLEKKESLDLNPVKPRAKGTGEPNTSQVQRPVQEKWAQDDENDDMHQKNIRDMQALLKDKEGDISPEELAKRKQYLLEQRDKLLQLKLDARQKAFNQAESSGKAERPRTARAARSALGGRTGGSVDKEVLAARKALAEKLKSEIGNL